MICQDLYYSGNKQIDNFIQMQLRRSSHDGIVFEWIPYNHITNEFLDEVWNFLSI